MNKQYDELQESYNEYLTKLQPGVLAVIENIRNKEFGESIDDLLNLVEGLTWIATVNNELQSKGNVKLIDIDKLNEINKQLISSIVEQDSYLCADILEYELLGFIIKLENNMQN